MTEETKLEVPNFAATTVGKKMYSPKQWLEILRQYTKRKHIMDITELIRKSEIAQTGWSGKNCSTKSLHLGHWPRST